MIAKIAHGTNIMGALLYNFLKVDTGKGCVLDAQNIRQAQDGTFTLRLSCRSFEPYLAGNINTEKPALHISLNPDPSDNVDDDRYLRLAADYMHEMGYGGQPYIVFKHNDIERAHIHIVSTNVNGLGRKISDTFEHKRSMAACRALEKKYGLTPPKQNEKTVDPRLFKPVDYKKENIKGQIAAVARYLPQYYHYQGLGTYNALLSLFNITVQEVCGQLNGKPRQGLVYFALDAQGQKASHPFKASLFGKSAGHAAMLEKFEKSQQIFSDRGLKNALKDAVEVAVYSSKDEKDFCGQLSRQGINVAVRRNSQGRIYGITFIDHSSRSVWNGSQLDKKLSANAFEQWWNNGNTFKDPAITGGLGNERADVFAKPYVAPKHAAGNTGMGYAANPDTLFQGFMDMLIPTSHAEDSDELEFAYRMKKRKRKNK